MSKTVVVQYRTRPDAADENQRLVEQVYAQLARENPDGLRYATFRLADGVTFISIIEGEFSPVTQMSAFADYQREIGERCVEAPRLLGASLVGSYRFQTADSFTADTD
ncbi:MAG TPA: hypothetical protein VJO13_01265 [Ktedonobacterales bacterium]|nr:hypothetical protein [Ktedonobacterales bacterium]